MHLTAQLAKVIERLIKTMMEPHLEKTHALGDNQFAYRKERGSRDMILMLMLEWLITLDKREKSAFIIPTWPEHLTESIQNFLF